MTRHALLLYLRKCWVFPGKTNITTLQRKSYQSLSRGESFFDTRFQGSPQYQSGYGVGRIDFPAVKKVMTRWENRPKKIMTPFEIHSKNPLYQVNFGQKSLDPVTKPVEKRHEPVVKQTEKSHDPVVKPVEKSHDPVGVPSGPVFRLILGTPF